MTIKHSPTSHLVLAVAAACLLVACSDDDQQVKTSTDAGADGMVAPDQGGPASDTRGSGQDAQPSPGDGQEDAAPATVLGQVGEPCHEQAPCQEDLKCLIPAESGTTGVCSPPCDNPEGDCDFTLGNTYPICVMPHQDSYYCAFVCKIEHGHSHEYPCPEGLVCPEQENPAGSGQYLCVAP